MKFYLVLVPNIIRDSFFKIKTSSSGKQLSKNALSIVQVSNSKNNGLPQAEVRSYLKINQCNVFGNINLDVYTAQKQPSRDVLRKTFSANIQQIFRRTLTSKCGFNKVALQVYWNHAVAWAFSCKAAAYF